MDPTSQGFNLTCSSDCFKWCPRTVQINCCCKVAADSDSGDDTDYKTHELAKSALLKEDQVEKSKSCVIL